MAMMLGLVSGCTLALTPLYPGPRLPAAQVAQIASNEDFYVFADKFVRIVSVDGNKCDLDVEVLPGRHLVGLAYDGAAANVAVASLRPCYVPLQAEAGHRYKVYGESSYWKRSWRCWITDVATGQRTEGLFLGSGLPAAGQMPAQEAGPPHSSNSVQTTEPAAPGGAPAQTSASGGP